MTGKRAGIYARISQDDGTALGVGRQVDDCTAEAERRGWTIVDEYVDNNVSASKTKPRPEYTRMIDDAEQGRIDAVICWDVDRLTRKPAELESFIDLADRHGLSLASVGGEIDLATPQGRLTARIKGSVARHEAEQMGRRIARKAEQTAREGLSTIGPAPFGYERREVDRNGSRLKMLTPLEPEAGWIRDAYRRLLDGDTLRQISLDMKAAGVTGKRGQQVQGAMLGHMLRRPVYAGIRTYHGERLGPGEWEALVDADAFDRAQAILESPGRFHTRGTAPRYLLSGIAKCGHCGAAMRPKIAKSYNRAPAYTCPDCTRITRVMRPVDMVVEAVIVARLETLDLDLADVDPGEHQAAREARDALTARLDTAADEYAAGNINARQLARITETLEAELVSADRLVASTAPNPAVANVTGEGASAAWDASPLEQKRAIIRALCDVTVLPSGPGQRFKPEDVRIDWKA
ncbi:recombinase family protein [Brachybacterium alimentarium]|uniref:recombinase family protein n=1 Tax=Brachybacterium alimentarium TaxID=47845 RepID=UPI003FD26303